MFSTRNFVFVLSVVSSILISCVPLTLNVPKQTLVNPNPNSTLKPSDISQPSNMPAIISPTSSTSTNVNVSPIPSSIIPSTLPTSIVTTSPISSSIPINSGNYGGGGSGNGSTTTSPNTTETNGNVNVIVNPNQTTSSQGNVNVVINTTAPITSITK